MPSDFGMPSDWYTSLVRAALTDDSNVLDMLVFVGSPSFPLGSTKRADLITARAIRRAHGSRLRTDAVERHSLNHRSGACRGNGRRCENQTWR